MHHLILLSDGCLGHWAIARNITLQEVNAIRGAANIVSGIRMAITSAERAAQHIRLSPNEPLHGSLDYCKGIVLSLLRTGVKPSMLLIALEQGTWDYSNEQNDAKTRLTYRAASLALRAAYSDDRLFTGLAAAVEVTNTERDDVCDDSSEAGTA